MQFSHNRRNPKIDKETCLRVQEDTELLKFLLSELSGKGRNHIKSLLFHGQISVDNETVVQFNHRLETGQKVVVNWNKGSSLKGLKILFEDEYLVVVEKEAGLLSIATDREKELTAYSLLSEYIKAANPKNRIFIVHRLDKETSGVMVFAKSKEIQQLLQNSWKAVVTERIYAAVVEGSLNKEQGTITSWLKESKTLLMYSSRTANDGQKAVTHYQVLKKNNKYSLLEVKLETGRKNQIRVHMQDLGHCVIGDKKYGSSMNPIKRLGLHAIVLAFKHPKTDEIIRCETQIPKEFQSLFA